MNLFKTASCILALALCSGAAMARQADLIDHQKILLLTDGTPLTEQQVRGRIVNAAHNIGWQPTKDEPGHMELMYDKAGKHQVYIEVNYDAAGFDINYLRSNNLDYEERDGQRKIHPAYNRWIKNLNKQISAPVNATPAAPGAAR